MEHFAVVYQNKLINDLIHMAGKIPKTGKISIGGHNIDLMDFTPVNARILDILLLKINLNGKYDTTLSVAEYSEICGIRRQTATEQLEYTRDVFDELFDKDMYIDSYFDDNIAEEGKGLRGNEKDEYENWVKEEYTGSYIVNGSRCYKNHGLYDFWFSTDFINSVRDKDKGNVMPFPLALFRVSLGRYPNAYGLGRRIAEHKFMNLGKPNENIISTQTLINAAPSLEKRKKAIHYTRDIVRPFERDLDLLADIFKWEYALLFGDSKTPPKNYNEFMLSKIKIEWLDYPNDWDLVVNRIKKNTTPHNKGAKR